MANNTGGSLGPGSVVGGRFEVATGEAEQQDALGVLLRAKDQKSGRAIALRVFRPEVVDADAKKALRTASRVAAKLRDDGIIATYGVGSDPSGASFLASEWPEGQTVAQLVADHASREAPVPLLDAYNIVAQVCRALSVAAVAKQPAVHGTLRPSVVWVSGDKTKVADFGLSAALVATRGAGVLGAEEQACLAPEVKQGQAPTGVSDIFGVGAILYQLLTLRSPADGFVPPSQAHPEATAALDEVLMACLAPDPAQRFETPDEVWRALMPLVPGASEPANAPKAKPRAAKPAGASPAVGARVSAEQTFKPSADPLSAAVAKAPAAQPASAMVDLGEMLKDVTDNDAQRWMVTKEGLDHGPFSGRELVKMITQGDIKAEHPVMNMDTGERKTVERWPKFAEFEAQFRAKVAAEKHEAAVEVAETSEKRSGRTKIIAAASLMVVLIGGVVAFAMTREAARDEVASGELGNLYEIGDITIRGTAEELPQPSHHGSGRRHGRRSGMSAMGAGGSGEGSGSGGLSYEEAMERAVALGDISMGSGGGGGVLPSSRVAGIINQNSGRLARCVAGARGRGESLGSVTVDLAILGSGRVQGASVRPGSSEFKTCVRRAMRGIHFPTFGAARMGARYRFSGS